VWLPVDLGVALCFSLSPDAPRSVGGTPGLVAGSTRATRAQDGPLCVRDVPGVSISIYITRVS